MNRVIYWFIQIYSEAKHFTSCGLGDEAGVLSRWKCKVIRFSMFLDISNLISDFQGLLLVKMVNCNYWQFYGSFKTKINSKASFREEIIQKASFQDIKQTLEASIKFIAFEKLSNGKWTRKCSCSFPVQRFPVIQPSSSEVYDNKRLCNCQNIILG